MTHGLRVRVDVGMGTGKPKTTRGLPVPHPTCTGQHRPGTRIRPPFHKRSWCWCWRRPPPTKQDHNARAGARGCPVYTRAMHAIGYYPETTRRTWNWVPMVLPLVYRTNTLLAQANIVQVPGFVPHSTSGASAGAGATLRPPSKITMPVPVCMGALSTHAPCTLSATIPRQHAALGIGCPWRSPWSTGQHEAA